MSRAFKIDDNFNLDRLFLRNKDGNMIKIKYDYEEKIAVLTNLDRAGEEICGQRVTLGRCKNRVSDMLKFGYHEINDLAYEEHSKRLAELFKEYVRKADRMTSMTKIRIVRNGTTLGKNYVKSSLARNSKEYIKWTEECLREVLL